MPRGGRRCQVRRHVQRRPAIEGEWRLQHSAVADRHQLRDATAVGPHDQPRRIATIPWRLPLGVQLSGTLVPQCFPHCCQVDSRRSRMKCRGRKVEASPGFGLGRSSCQCYVHTPRSLLSRVLFFNGTHCVWPKAVGPDYEAALCAPPPECSTWTLSALQHGVRSVSARVALAVRPTWAKDAAAFAATAMGRVQWLDTGN